MMSNGGDNSNEWLQEVKKRADLLGVAQYAQQDPVSSLYYLQNLDTIREFRSRHWNFTKEYIIKHTNHKVGTGGTPVISFLLNQLSTVLQLMVTVTNSITNLLNKNPISFTEEQNKLFQHFQHNVEVQERIIRKEQQYLKEKFPDK